MPLPAVEKMLFTSCCYAFLITRGCDVSLPVNCVLVLIILMTVPFGALWILSIATFWLELCTGMAEVRHPIMWDLDGKLCCAVCGATKMAANISG